jgi:hypothetical protein
LKHIRSAVPEQVGEEEKTEFEACGKKDDALDFP